MSLGSVSPLFGSETSDYIEEYIDLITPEAFDTNTGEVEMEGDNMDAPISAAMDNFLKHVACGQDAKVNILSDVVIQPARQPGELESILRDGTVENLTSATTTIDQAPRPSGSPVRDPSPTVPNMKRGRRRPVTQQRQRQKRSTRSRSSADTTEQQRQQPQMSAGLDVFTQERHRNIVLEFRRLRQELEMEVAECDTELVELQQRMDEVKVKHLELKQKLLQCI